MGFAKIKQTFLPAFFKIKSITNQKYKPNTITENNQTKLLESFMICYL